MTDTRPAIRVSEIFGPTVQGEGVLIGLPTVFIRTGGCDYRCSWCDSLHAVDNQFRREWEMMPIDKVWQSVVGLSGGWPVMVSLSGGNPAIQPFGTLIKLGHGEGYRFALETQGSVARDWFADLDVLVLSPKPPSSEMRTDWAAFEACIEAAQEKPQTVLKLVVFDENDYAYAKDAAARFPRLPVYLQPGNHTPPRPGNEDAPVDLDGIIKRMEWLVEKVTRDRWFEARVLPQLHVMLWGNKRGV
ncbi:MAG: 7-carboxy-7-deazaguanine synthase QueE [Mesorhizobium sp.]|uniref:7-carboxy-7-deazaguanine synthase QueE n=1 Tax=unclassified Mesorhizobium TaxID=325217 RepID=UPI000FD92D1C|nr:MULTISPECIES: 7-carboxy-7-deazaguanine synthase QueE [unclassified Mesorhizobium]TGV84636.1 7-carboxy-7-deazaguanine synthase QueE [Mesorhizobium sp. M00.F.Ca.ET.158.01.1.1]RWD01492.1 MAG: 7-carboxy-7-deazaguanine synthase QueE [Mesorhizobium sp.]RWE23368.1 MAG: 7-carboxy-7-deazaguanine synthase QueE [Mesorhizobium sp.]TGQ21300.1 7-carboxy-7-deazaguanine synthase QueE [Mesorhizobium sp. M00.F.Ca.ET.217.01.1.1]TIW22690.1 MAG: 7-carboxy-7-deazaguanine synthase QueE [Mesorhizobium sp.]